MGTGFFPVLKSDRRLTLTPHPILVPWSRKSRAMGCTACTERQCLCNGELLQLKKKTLVPVICLIIQYKTWKLSNYTARGRVQSQEMSMCARGTSSRSTRIYVQLWCRGTSFLFSLPDISNRPWGQACCFSVTSDGTSKVEPLRIEPSCKYWRSTIVFWYAIKWYCELYFDTPYGG